MEFFRFLSRAESKITYPIPRRRFGSQFPDLPLQVFRFFGQRLHSVSVCCFCFSSTVARTEASRACCRLNEHHAQEGTEQ